MEDELYKIADNAIDELFNSEDSDRLDCLKELSAKINTMIDVLEEQQ